MLYCNQITNLGTTLGRRDGQAFGIRQPDRLFHLFAIGQTGTGKTTLIASLARQDIERGRGFCLIDPHGDLAEQVADAIGKGGVYWNAADPASPYGYNPLSKVSAKWRPLVSSGLVETLKKQWPDAWGARMEHLLRFAVLALLEREDATLADILPLFLDKEFRKEVVAGIADEQVRHFWTVEYGKLRYQFTLDGVSPITNKLGAFLAHPVVRKAVCEPENPLRFRQIMDRGGILVVNLAKGRLGADISNVLGGMIVSGIASAAYSRQDQPEEARRPFFLYVDEFHSFTTSAFADMLAELRKYGVGLVLTTQHFAQIEPDVREAIMGNVGTLISFRVGATDAALLARQFGEDVPRPRDLVNLANHEVFIKLMVDGVQTKPFSARTLPPP
ncbi:MAG: type IV secretion system DNA-binding domain-containing protein [Rhizobiaceae bacterium]|nr:type IV secretion system DNA-binding domain-containing protein [Rhizobiaceae bacterium]